MYGSVDENVVTRNSQEPNSASPLGAMVCMYLFSISDDFIEHIYPEKQELTIYIYSQIWHFLNTITFYFLIILIITIFRTQIT